MTIVPLAAALLLWILLSQMRPVKRALRLLMPALPAKLVAILLVVLAMLVAAHGNLWAALCLFGASLWSLGRTPRHAVRAAASQRVVAADAGGLYVLAGRFAGRRLDDLDLAACLLVRARCRSGDRAGAALLESYLDRRFPGWRPAADGDADARRGQTRFANELSEEEAYQVLGLGRGATRADIVRSHRVAMKRCHPDRGGTADAAARANQAKEVLLRRHG